MKDWHGNMAVGALNDWRDAVRAFCGQMRRLKVAQKRQMSELENEMRAVKQGPRGQLPPGIKARAKSRMERKKDIILIIAKLESEPAVAELLSGGCDPAMFL